MTESWSIVNGDLRHRGLQLTSTAEAERTSKLLSHPQMPASPCR